MKSKRLMFKESVGGYIGNFSITNTDDIINHIKVGSKTIAESIINQLIESGKSNS